MLEITEYISDIIGNPMIDLAVFQLVEEVEENHRSYLDSQKEELKKEKSGPLY